MDLRSRLLSFGLFLFLVAVMLSLVSSGFSGKTAGQDQQKRWEFYALQVVCEKQVQNAKDSLGAPDGSHAEILPGGQLEMLMEKILSPSLIAGYGENPVCLDSGSVVGKGETDFRLEGRFTWEDTQGEQCHEWIPLLPTLTGFCVLPIANHPFEDNADVDMIRITNPGTKSLFVDAVIGYTWMFWQSDALMRRAEAGPKPWPPET